MRSELIWSSLTEKSLQLNQTSTVWTHSSNNFKHCFTDCWRSIAWLVMILTHSTPQLTKTLHFFKRKKFSLRLRWLCEQDHREMMDENEITAVNETWNTTSSEHLVKTVTAFLDTSLSAAFFAAKLITCITASMYLLSNELFNQSFASRSQANQLQSTYDGKCSSMIERDTRHLMLRLMRRVIFSSQNQALRMRMNQMRKLLLCLRKSSVRSLDLIELQTLMSSHIWLINFNSSETLWCEYVELSLRSKREDYMLTTAAQSQCKIRSEISYFCTTFSMFQSLTSIYCQKSRCARKIFEKVLTLKSYTCTMRMISLCLRHLRMMMSM